jgi:hypothetical protein
MSAFTEPTINDRSDIKCLVPTLRLQQVDGILCGTAQSSDRDSVLDVITSKVTFVHPKKLTALFYAKDIDQCTQYIRIYAGFYIDSCLAKLGWEVDSTDPSVMPPPITPVVLKTLMVTPSPMDPTDASPSQNGLVSHTAPLLGCLYMQCKSTALTFLPPSPFYISLTKVPCKATYLMWIVPCTTSVSPTPDD